MLSGFLLAKCLDMSQMTGAGMCRVPEREEIKATSFNSNRGYSTFQCLDLRYDSIFSTVYVADLDSTQHQQPNSCDLE